jgi:hypothetical protein
MNGKYFKSPILGFFHSSFFIFFSSEENLIM